MRGFKILFKDLFVNFRGDFLRIKREFSRVFRQLIEKKINKFWKIFF